MTPRNSQPPRDKREELKTYRDLALRRDLKSIRGRRKLERGGARRVLGDGSSLQPYLAVDAARYRQVRLEIQRQLLIEARATGLALSADRLLHQLKPRIEALTYTRLSDELGHEARHEVPVPALGRGLTVEERKHFAASRGTVDDQGCASTRNTRSALDRVLGSIERRQTHNPARHQTIWAQIVGADAAQQSHFEGVDANTQTAYFRCFNSVLSTHLQRRPGLAQKLARELGLPVRQLRVRF